MTFARVLCLCILAWGLRAQPAPTATDAREGSVSGRVIKAATGQPLPGVTVYPLSRDNEPPAKTDAQGRFHFERLGKRRYRLIVDGDSGYTALPVLVDLRAGQKLTNIEIKASPNAVVSGKVEDEKHRPASGITVSLLVLYDGLPAQRVNRATTDDDGEFRITNVQPGRYKLVAEKQTVEVRPSVSSEEHLPKQPVETTVSTYYPNSTSLEGGAIFAVVLAQAVEGMNITLAREKTACVLSKAVDDAAKGALPITVHAHDEWHWGARSLAHADVRHGTGFAVCGLPPGSYDLSGWVKDDDAGNRHAYQEFSVTDRNIRVPDLNLQPLARVPGRLTIDGEHEKKPFTRPVSVGLDTLGGCIGEQRFASVSEEGAFELPAVCALRYWLRVVPPDGFYVKSASIAGVNALREQFLPYGELNVVLGQDGPTLTVQVNDEDGQPVANSTVVVVRDPLPTRLILMDLTPALTEANGQAVFKRIAPGSYRVFALAAGADDSDMMTLQFLLAHQSESERIDLSAREKRTLPVKPIGGRN